VRIKARRTAASAPPKRRRKEDFAISRFCLRFLADNLATLALPTHRILMVPGFLAVLPLDIFRLILQYLFRHDLENFEISILVNQSLTQFYLEALQGIEIFGLDYALDSRMIQWLLKRNIVLKDIKFHRLDVIGCEYISKSRHWIHSISLYYGHRILGRFAELKCPNLTSLKINHLTIEDQNLLKLLRLHPQLISLEIFNCKIFDSGESDFFLSLFSSCSNLRHLDLSSNDWFTDDLVGVVIRRLPFLESISFDDTALRQDQSLIDIITAYPSLKTFSFSRSYFQPETVKRVLRHCGARQSRKAIQNVTLSSKE
jgi:hypothetical protein